MSEAEKVQLRYIQILKSTTQWQGDMGRTLVSPSNAVRVLKEQFTLLGRAVGRVFLPIIMKTIPYVMALTEILTDLANRLAAFFGYEFTDIDYSNLGNISSGLESIGDEAESTTKKLNTMLAPFDELNVVQSKASSTGSGSSLGGDLGVDLPEYDALAGLTDQFKKNVESAKENLEKIWSVAKKLATIFGTIWAVNKLSKFISNLKNLKTLFTTSKTPISTFSGLLKTLVTRFSDGYKYSKFMGETGLKSVLSGFQNLLTPASKFGLTLSGIVISFADGYKNMKDYAKGDSEFRDSLGKTIGVVGTLAGLATLLVNPWAGLGIVISGVIGSVKGYYDGIHEVEVLNSVFDGQGIHIETLTGYFTNLFDESTKYTGTIENLANKYNTAKQSVADSRTELDLFMESLNLQDGAVTQSQLNELTSKYKDLKNETKAAHDANDSYYIGLIKASANARNANDSDTAKLISNYKSVSSTLLGYEQDYIDKEEALTKKRYEGKISVSEYNEQIKALKIQYGYMTDNLNYTNNAVSSFETNLSDIDYGSVENLNTQISTTKEGFNDTITSLNKYKDELIKTNDAANKSLQSQIDNLKNSSLANSDFTKGLITSLQEQIAINNSATETSVNDANNAIQKVQGEYKGYLATIYGDLTTQGADTVKKFSGTMSTIKEELKGLGDVDMSGTGKTLYDNLESSILGSGDQSLIVKLRDAMKKVGIDGSDTLMDYLTPSEKLRESMYSDYSDFGENIGGGAINGVENKREAFIDKLEEVSSDGQNSFCEDNGIQSPSTVYEEFGEYIIEGLAEGLDESSNKVTSTLSNISKSMSDVMNGINLTFDTSGFTTCLDSILGKLQTFSDKFKSGVNSLMSSFTTSMNGIKVGNDNKLYYTKMPNVKIPRFENGGYPTSGDLFYANENGIPEMVGRIGNKTAVANNDQITTSLTNALITALGSYNFGNKQPSTTVVNIGGRKVYEGVGDYVDSENDRYGTNYVHV